MDEATLVDAPEREPRPEPAPAGRAGLAVGSPVEVRNRFCSAWSGGFEVADATGRGYRVRRQSDGYVLPAEFGPSELRRPAARDFPRFGASVSIP